MKSGFDEMGGPVPTSRREVAYTWAKSLGMTDEGARSVVNNVANKLEHDKPYEAQQEALKCLDLASAYMLMSYLITNGEENESR